MYLLLKKYQLEMGKMFLLGLLIAPIALLGQGFYQIQALGFPSAVGAYNSIIFGDVSMLIVVITVCALLTVSQKWHHYLLGVLVVCMALSASVISGTRGAWILLPVALVWFLWIKRKSLGLKSLMLVMLLGVLLLLGAGNLHTVKSRVNIAIQQYQSYLENPAKMSSIGERLEMWQDSITIWKARPLLGSGIGDFKNDRLQLFKNGQSNLGVDYDHAHNIYFDILATAGLTGLFGMLIFMQIIPFQMFYSFWIKEHDPWVKFYALSGMTAIIAFAVFGLTEGWLARKPFVHTYIMCLLVFMSSIAIVKGEEKEKS